MGPYLSPLHNSAPSFAAGLWPRLRPLRPSGPLVRSIGNDTELPCFFTEPLSASPQGVEWFLITMCQIRVWSSIASLSFPPCECQCVCAAAPRIPVFGYLARLFISTAIAVPLHRISGSAALQPFFSSFLNQAQFISVSLARREPRPFVSEAGRC